MGGGDGVIDRHITSKDNPLLQKIRRLGRNPAAYRDEGVAWIEGDHLCRAYLNKRGPPVQVVCTEGFVASGLHRDLLCVDAPLVQVADAIFKSGSGLASPTGVGYLIEVVTKGSASMPDPQVHSVVLDRVQDAGNVGAILRSAAALGVGQVLALRGTVALWAPKVVRAGMGAHFSLRMCEGLEPADFEGWALPMLATSSHATTPIFRAQLPFPCAWVIGNEGGGVNAVLIQQCQQTVAIPQPGGEESLNVAAAAAICFYESIRQQGL